MSYLIGSMLTTSDKELKLTWTFYADYWKRIKDNKWSTQNGVQ